MWCHVRHLNVSRIKKINKKTANALDYGGVEFPVKVKDIGVIEDKNETCMKIKLFVQFMLVRKNIAIV